MQPRPRSAAQDAVYCPKCERENEEFNPRCRFCGELLPRESCASRVEDGTAQAGNESVPEAIAVGQRVGPYRLVSLLGRGGMGVVYRAVDESDGQREVALKTLAVPHAAFLPGLRREIQALSRLRDPGIVRILENGLHEGLPWYAMELVEGVTLRRLIAQQNQAVSTVQQPWWTLSLESLPSIGAQESLRSGGVEPGTVGQAHEQRRSELQPVLDVLHRLCGVLSHLHGEGLIHRDLKPDNVLVRPDGQPVLVDFGLSVRFSDTVSRETLGAEIGGGGTVAYMSPEQLLGEPLDARADLYALGCMLFEVLTGRAPFVGTAQAMADAHLRRTPQKPSALSPWVGTEFDDLVLKLLAKRPRDRLGYADAVAAALGKLHVGGSEAASRGKAYLYRPGFAGREAALGVLANGLSKLIDSHRGGIVLVAGESGVGKTRLLLELGREAARRNILVLPGECVPGSGSPLEALRKPLQHVADRCRAGGREETDRLLGPRLKVLAPYQPALRDVPGHEACPETTELPFEAARQRLFAALAGTMQCLAVSGVEKDQATQSPREAAVLLILDDLQWADDLTFGFLELVSRIGGLRASHGAAILVVGAYRSEELEAAHSAPLRALVRAPETKRLELARLEAPAVTAMVEDMLALQPAPDAFVQFLNAQSEGNPFFVAEYLRTAVAEGMLTRDALGRWQVVGTEERPAREADYAALPLPLSVRELVGRRLDGLPEAAIGLCEAAAVLGREAEIGLVAQMTQLDELRLDLFVHELVARQVLDPPEAGRLRFVHDKIREVAEGRLEQTRLRALHRAAAAAIESRPAGERDERSAALARHWHRAGEINKAKPMYLAAARLAQATFDSGGAEGLYRAYLELEDGLTAQTIQARNEYGSVLLNAGKNAEAVEAHTRAAQDAQTLQDRAAEASSLEQLQCVHAATSRGDLFMFAIQQALALRQSLGDRAGEAVNLMRQGNAAVNLGTLDEAERLLTEAQTIFCELNDQDGLARNGHNLGTLNFQRGRHQIAVDHFEECLRLFRALGSARDEAMILTNLGAVEVALRRFPEAKSCFDQALAIQRRIGDRTNEILTLNNLGALEMEYGLLEESRLTHARGLRIARELGRPRDEALLLVGLGVVECRMGNATLAATLLEQGEKIYLQIGMNLHRSLALSKHGHALLALGQPAGELLEEARQLLSAAHSGPDSMAGRAAAKLGRAIAAHAAGEHDRLFNGEFIDDLPEGLRQKLIAKGLIKPPAAAPGPR